MKKIVSLVLCCSLLMGSPSMALFGTGAASLKQYAFIQGNEKGDLMVEKPLTRAEACVLLSEIYGVKETAKQYRLGGDFKDVQKNQWFFGYISYAKSKGWVDGYTDGTFKPTNTISSKEWASMLIRALSYKMEWTTVEEDLLTIGVVVEAQNPDSILRGEAFEAMWQAVNVPRNGKEISLGVELGRLEAPPQPIEPQKLAIGEITSLRELVLKTDGPLDAKGVSLLKNYEVSAKGMQDLAVIKVEYNESQGKIHLILNRAMTQNSEVELKVKGLVGKNGLPLENQTLTIKLVDTTMPSIVSAEQIGKRFIRVVFSEPLMSLEDQMGSSGLVGIQKLSQQALVLNDGTLGIKDISLQKGHKVAIVETFGDLKDSLKIKAREGAKDYMNIRVMDKNVDVTYALDTLAPKIVGYENLSPTEVTLIFNEDIRLMNFSNASFYHTSPANIVDEMVVGKHLDGNRLTLKFSRNMMNSGNQNIYIASNVLADYSGNLNASLSYSLNIEKDTVAPEVLKVIPISDTVVRVYFSEPIFNRNNEIHTRSNYKLVDEAGKDISDLIRTWVYKAEDQSVDLVLASPLKGLYKLSVMGLKDYSENLLVENSNNFMMKNLTPPNPSKWVAKLYQGGTQNQMIKIKFDEPMALNGGNSILLPEKYVINGMALDKLDQGLLRIESPDQGNSVLIYYPGKLVKNGVDFNTIQSGKIEIGRLADVDGNYIQAFSTSLVLDTQSYLKIEKVSQIDKNKVQVLISDHVEQVDVSDFLILGPNRWYQVLESQVTYGNNETSIVLTLNMDFDDTIAQTKFRIIGFKTKNNYGEIFNPQKIEFPIEDKMKPYVIRTAIDGLFGDHVIYSKSTGIAEIKFSEPIDPKTISLLSFSIGTYKIRDVQVIGNVVRLYVDFPEKDKVSLYDALTQRVEIRDLSGNGVENLILNFTKIYP